MSYPINFYQWKCHQINGGDGNIWNGHQLMSTIYAQVI